MLINMEIYLIQEMKITKKPIKNYKKKLRKNKYNNNKYKIYNLLKLYKMKVFLLKFYKI
jgi:hypothetical protein